MNNGRKFVVMSGLPGSGKTTIGKKLSEAFQFQFLDKDDILESLLSEHLEFSSELRQRLSRESDLIFREKADSATDAVLVSFWRSPNENSTSGTASDWLTKYANNVIEIFCRCDADIAVDRFLNRERHPGHMDHLRSRSMLQDQFNNLKSRWPLGVGNLIELNTSNVVTVSEVSREIRRIWPLV